MVQQRKDPWVRVIHNGNKRCGCGLLKPFPALTGMLVMSVAMKPFPGQQGLVQGTAFLN